MRGCRFACWLEMGHTAEAGFSAGYSERSEESRGYPLERVFPQARRGSETRQVTREILRGPAALL